MFRIISTITFLVVLGGIFVHCVVSGISRGYQWRPIDILKTLVHLFTLLFLEQKLNVVGVLRKLIYQLALLCFVVLAITGFYPVLAHGEHLSGYILIVHATFAPVFAICLAVLAVMWAHNCRFNRSDWPWLQGIIPRETAASEAVDEKQGLMQKVCFWLIVVLAVPVILSIVLSMFTLFGTQGQEFLLSTHRYSTLLLVLVAIIHSYVIIRAKMEQ